MLGFDDNSSNSAQESSPNEESNDSSDDFSANKPSASKKKRLKSSVFCSCLVAESGQHTGTAVARLGRKGLNWKLNFWAILDSEGTPDTGLFHILCGEQ